MCYFKLCGLAKTYISVTVNKNAKVCSITANRLYTRHKSSDVQ